MKIKEGFVLRRVAGTWVVLPLSKPTVDFNGMLTLNESAVLIWRMLEVGATFDTLIGALTEEYEVEESVAKGDIEKLLEKLRKVGCIEE